MPWRWFSPVSISRPPGGLCEVGDQLPPHGSLASRLRPGSRTFVDFRIGRAGKWPTQPPNYLAKLENTFRLLGTAVRSGLAVI